MSPVRGKTLICLLVLFSADSFFTSDNSCACVKDVHPYVQQLNKLWTKQSHLSPPTPLQLCLSEAVLRILSVCKLFELGSFCLLAWCFEIHQYYVCSLAGVHDSLRWHLEAAGQQLWHLAHTSQTCGR